MAKQPRNYKNSGTGTGDTRVYAPTHKTAQDGTQNRSSGGRGAAPSAFSRSQQKQEQPSAAYQPRQRKKHTTKEETPHKNRPLEEQGSYQGLHRLERMQKEELRQAALQQLNRKNLQPEKLSGEEALPPGQHAQVKQGDKPASKKEHSKKRHRRNEQKEPSDPRKVLTGLITGVVLASLLLAGWFVFLLEDIQVKGNQQYSADSIISLTGLTAGRHMLLCNLEEAREGVEANPYLKVVSIERKWPRTIVITVEERKEAAVIHTLDGDVIIDLEGHVLSIGSGSDLSHLVWVVGVSLTGYQVNQTIANDTDFQTQTLLTLLEKLQEYDLVSQVAQADISNPLRIWLLTRDGIQVVLGQSTELDDKLTWMKAALPSLQISGITSGTLDVSAKGGAIWSPDKAQPNQPQPEQGQDDAAQQTVPEVSSGSDLPEPTNEPST